LAAPLSGEVADGVLRLESSVLTHDATESVRPRVELAGARCRKVARVQGIQPELGGIGEAIAAKNCGAYGWM
jgi:hypothetical protein